MLLLLLLEPLSEIHTVIYFPSCIRFRILLFEVVGCFLLVTVVGFVVCSSGGINSERGYCEQIEDEEYLPPPTTS